MARSAVGARLMGLYGAAKRFDIDAIGERMEPVVEEFFNGNITIYNPNIQDGAFDVWKNTVAGRSHTELWTGSARIQPVRWPVMVTGKAEQSAYKAVRFQIPLDADIDTTVVREGMRIQVNNGGRFKDIENMLFVVTAATNSSFAFNRTIDAVVDTGVDIS